MIDEKVTGSGRLKKDDKLDNERQDIPSGFLRSGVHVEPLSDSIDEDILLPGNFGRPLKGYRYVRINRAELVAAKRAGKQQPDRSSGGYSEDRDEGGRPTCEKEIVEAGLYLLGRNEIDPAKPGKSNWHKVREHVQKRVGTDDARGLSDQTIRRHLKAIFDAHGKTRG